MATSSPTKAAKRTMKKTTSATTRQRTMSHMPKSTRSPMGKQSAAMAPRKRTMATAPKTKAELYEMARRRDMPGRSKMGRAELARKLGVR